MTDARIGYGSKYEIYISGAFVEMGEVTEITPGEATTERVQATHMQSPGRRHEYISGMIDSGEGIEPGPGRVAVRHGAAVSRRVGMGLADPPTRGAPGMTSLLRQERKEARASRQPAPGKYPSQALVAAPTSAQIAGPFSTALL